MARANGSHRAVVGVVLIVASLCATASGCKSRQRREQGFVRTYTSSCVEASVRQGMERSSAEPICECTAKLVLVNYEPREIEALAKRGPVEIQQELATIIRMCKEERANPQ